MSKQRNDAKVTGKRYSKRTVLANGTIEVLSWDTHHLLTKQGLQDLKEWSLGLLETEGIPARALADGCIEDWTNEGEPLLEHVRWIDGIEPDDKRYLAAHVYREARAVEVFRENPGLTRQGALEAAAFRLGRLSMLAKVYGVDEHMDAKRQEYRDRGARARRIYSDSDRAKWRQLRTDCYPQHTLRRAAELIATACGLESSAEETIRKELGKQNG